jgi:hypothetical protein
LDHHLLALGARALDGLGRDEALEVLLLLLHEGDLLVHRSLGHLVVGEPASHDLLAQLRVLRLQALDHAILRAHELGERHAQLLTSGQDVPPYVREERQEPDVLAALIESYADRNHERRLPLVRTQTRVRVRTNTGPCYTPALV